MFAGHPSFTYYISMPPPSIHHMVYDTWGRGGRVEVHVIYYLYLLSKDTLKVPPTEKLHFSQLTTTSQLKALIHHVHHSCSRIILTLPISMQQ